MGSDPPPGTAEIIEDAGMIETDRVRKVIESEDGGIGCVVAGEDVSGCPSDEDGCHGWLSRIAPGIGVGVHLSEIVDFE